MVSKSLGLSFSFQFISKIKILYSICSLFIFVFLLQVIITNHQANNSDFTTLSDVEKEYRKTFNLMAGPSEEVGHECTLGHYTNHIFFT